MQPGPRGRARITLSCHTHRRKADDRHDGAPPVSSLPRPTARSAAVLLLSGGLDSTTMLALATREGYAVHALTFRYGQRHAHEVAMARRAAARWGVVRHEIVDIDLRTFGGSALTSDEPVPKDRSASE